MNAMKISYLSTLAAAVSLATASATSFAQGSLALEEIIVTSQKREQNYLDVPVSVSTFTGELLDVAKVTEFKDLVQVSPSVTFTQTGDQRGVGVLIRGIGTTAFQIAVEPTVATVVDGITLGRTAQSVMDLDDIERVEILRGPQGTLFGKNATGGLLMIKTNDPTEEFEGKIKATVTDDDGYAVSAVVSGPLSDSMRGRLSAYTKEFDGFGTNPFLGVDINGDESSGMRAKLAIDISDRTELMLIADYAKQDRNCCDNFFSGAEGASAAIVTNTYAAFGATIGEKNTVWLDATETFSNTKTWGLSAEFNVELDKWRFVSVTGYRGFNLETDQGVDGLPYLAGVNLAPDKMNGTPILALDTNGAAGGSFAGASMPGGDQEQKQFSQEFRLESNNWERMQVTLGGFYWDQKVDRYFQRISYFLGNGPAYGWMDAEADTTSWALFANGEYQLTEDLTIFGGLRYTDDDVSAGIVRTTPAPGVAVPGGATASNSTTESDVSGKIGLQYNLNESWMIYGSAGTGYKGPAYDLIFASNQERLANAIPPEDVTAYELGIKGEFWDGRARLGATLFHTSYDNLQGQGFDQERLAFLLVSAGEAVTEGLEVDLTLKPTPNWLINMGYAYTDATYESYPKGECYPGQSAAEGCVGGQQDLSGHQIANAPKNKFTMQTRLDFDLGGSFVPYIGGSYRYQSESPSDYTNDPKTLRESYGILDLNAGVEAADGMWQVEVFVKNATDKFYTDRPGYSGLLGGYQSFLTRDAWRYAGVEATYRF